MYPFQIKPTLFLSSAVHPDSAFINLSGQLDVNTEAAMNRVNEIFDRYEQIRLIMESYAFAPGLAEESLTIRKSNALLTRFGYQVNLKECIEIEDIGYPRANELHFYYLCSLSFDETLKLSHKKKSREVAPIFEAVEEHCSQHFTPPTAVSRKLIVGWERYYTGTEVFLRLENERLFLTSWERIQSLPLGNTREWLANPELAALKCDNIWLKTDNQFMSDF